MSSNKSESNSNTPNNKRKRIVSYQMAKKACFHCKKSHRKCNDERPCLNCVKSNKTCYDVENKYRKNVVPPSFKNPNNVANNNSEPQQQQNNNNVHNISAPPINSAPSRPTKKIKEPEKNMVKKTAPKKILSTPTNSLLPPLQPQPHKQPFDRDYELNTRDEKEKFQSLINIMMHASQEIDRFESDGVCTEEHSHSSKSPNYFFSQNLEGRSIIGTNINSTTAQMRYHIQPQYKYNPNESNPGHNHQDKFNAPLHPTPQHNPQPHTMTQNPLHHQHDPSKLQYSSILYNLSEAASLFQAKESSAGEDTKNIVSPQPIKSEFSKDPLAPSIKSNLN